MGTPIFQGCLSFQKHTCRRVIARQALRLGKHSWVVLSPRHPSNTSLLLRSSCISEIQLIFRQHFSALSCPVKKMSIFFTFLIHWEFNTTPCKVRKTSGFKTKPLSAVTWSLGLSTARISGRLGSHEEPDWKSKTKIGLQLVRLQQ